MRLLRLTRALIAIAVVGADLSSHTTVVGAIEHGHGMRMQLLRLSSRINELTSRVDSLFGDLQSKQTQAVELDSSNTQSVLGESGAPVQSGNTPPPPPPPPQPNNGGSTSSPKGGNTPPPPPPPPQPNNGGSTSSPKGGNTPPPPPPPPQPNNGGSTSSPKGGNTPPPPPPNGGSTSSPKGGNTPFPQMLSDSRLKNIHFPLLSYPIHTSYESSHDLYMYQYTWNNMATSLYNLSGCATTFIAQDVAQMLPQYVIHDVQHDMLMVDYTGLMQYLSPFNDENSMTLLDIDGDQCDQRTPAETSSKHISTKMQSPIADFIFVSKYKSYHV